MIRAIIVEDEKKAISALKQDLKLNCPEITVIDIAETVKDSVFKINSLEPDLVFLDIQLSDGLGFDILDQLNNINFSIIFTTAYSEYAIKAIKFSALDYLLKPINSKELKEAVKKVKLQNKNILNQQIKNLIYNHSNNDKQIALQTSEGVFIHNTSSIIRCKSDGNYTKVYFEKDKGMLIVKPLKEFEELLSPYGFYRIHHSHLINLKHLKSFIAKDGGYVVMNDKSTLPVSQRKRRSFVKALDKLNY